MEIVNQIVRDEKEKDILEKVPVSGQIEEKDEVAEQNEEEILVKPEEEPTNCVALTVRKDYKLTIAKNIAKKGAKMSWKVALSLAVINFLNTFF